jgi:hypothetical protein
MENLQLLNSSSHIIIVGGGWFGCHALRFLTEAGFNCTLYESNSDIFMGGSGFNQNRLHLGYHYPRSYDTRTQSLKGYSKFIEKYGFCVADVHNNIYSIHKDSISDAQTYFSIFLHEGYKFEVVESTCANYTASILVNEKYINPILAKEYFSRTFDERIFCGSSCHFKNRRLVVNGKELKYDLLIDCTYGGMIPNPNYFKRKFISFIVKKIGNVDFGALTVMDGPFYSIYPYKDNLFTVTGVVEGIIDEHFYENLAHNRYQKLSQKIELDLPKYNKLFEYAGYFISEKYLPFSHNDKRPTILQLLEKNVLSISGGKIDTIFEIDEFLTPFL